MTLRVRSSWALSCLLLPAIAAAEPGAFYGVSNGTIEIDPVTKHSQFLRIDASTGEGELIAEIDVPIVALDVNPVDGQLYGMYTVRRVSPTRTQLVTIDPLTATMTEIGIVTDPTGQTHQVAGIGFTSDGTLYGVSYRGRVLLEIDTDTAEAVKIGTGAGIPTLANFGSAMADDVLYFVNADPVAGSDLYTVDLATGAATWVGDMNVFPEPGVGVAFDGDGRLVAALGDTLYEIDPETAAVTEIGAIGFETVGSLEFVAGAEHACPCDSEWKNHGEYVSCVAQLAQDLDEDEADHLVSEAGKSECGK